MRPDTVIELLKTEDGTNENGFGVLNILGRKTVFGEKYSIRSSEFYQASQSGYVLELMFQIYKLEYDSEKYLAYQSKIYKIIRTYEKNNKVELVCQAYDESPVRT
ncbi:phage head closure protein [Neobacillus drentensis]|uniref:phage head closure protein n=1 Tax=Neobacillus drentensis TaxID=220684 RepID=UPI002FFF966D